MGGTKQPVSRSSTGGSRSRVPGIISSLITLAKHQASTETIRLTPASTLDLDTTHSQARRASTSQAVLEDLLQIPQNLPVIKRTEHSTTRCIVAGFSHEVLRRNGLVLRIVNLVKACGSRVGFSDFGSTLHAQINNT